MGLYYRKAGSVEEELPPELADLPPPVRQMFQTQIREIRKAEDPAALETALAQLEAQKGQLPPEIQPALPLIQREIQQRIEELQASDSNEGDAP